MDCLTQPSFVTLGFLSYSATIHFLDIKNKSLSLEEAFKLNFLLLHIKLWSSAINYPFPQMKASVVVPILFCCSHSTEVSLSHTIIHQQLALAHLLSCAVLGLILVPQYLPCIMLLAAFIYTLNNSRQLIKCCYHVYTSLVFQLLHLLAPLFLPRGLS